MPVTVQSLITDSLEELMAVPAGDTPNAQDLAKGLAVLIRMVDASNIHRGNIATLRIDLWNLVAGTQSYTIGIDPAGVLVPSLPTVAGTVTATGTTALTRVSGPLWTAALVGATFLIAGVPYTVATFTSGSALVMSTAVATVTAGNYILNPPVRPIRIERANILLTTGSGAVRRKLNLLDDKQWAAKSFLTTPGLPDDLYNDGAYPLSTYSLYPIPAAVYGLETYTWQQFAQSALADLLIIPPGYYEFWMYGLAVRLAAVYGKEPRAATLALFSEARAVVQALNCPSPRIRSDGDVGNEGRGREFYGWLDGYQDDY